MHHLGLTRSANRRDHLLLTPDTFVPTPLPQVDGSAIVHVSPQAGAAFTMMTLELAATDGFAWSDHQRFVYVVEGHLQINSSADQLSAELVAGSYAYFPPRPIGRSSLMAVMPSRVVVIDKPYESLSQSTERDAGELREKGAPWFFAGNEHEVKPKALNGDEDLQVRSLMPESLVFDFACNTMSYAPGASLSQVEIHYMEHGLLMLEGGGIYRLGDHWYPVQAGDFIWMAPYCPQWFCAVGKRPAKYLIYKNFNRVPVR